jgi:hypothetical protein
VLHPLLDGLFGVRRLRGRFLLVVKAELACFLRQYLVAGLF